MNKDNFLLKNCFNPSNSQIELNDPKKIIFQTVNFSNLDYLSKLLKETNLQNLLEISFINTNISDKVLESLSENESITNLQLLNLAQSFNISEKGLLKIFNSRISLKLKSIILQNLPIKNEIIYILCFSDKCKEIEILDISLCADLTDIAFVNIFYSENFNNLKKLDLSHTKITNFCLETMFSNNFGINLTNLIFHENYFLTNFAYEKLFQYENLKKLNFLQISCSLIENSALSFLVKNSFFENLKSFLLYDNAHIDTNGFDLFFNSKIISQLDLLDISNNCITNKNLENLIQNDFEYNLKVLKLMACKLISNEIIIKILKSGKFKFLKKINLAWTNIDQNLIDFIEDNKSIEYLDVRKCEKIDHKKLQNHKNNFKSLLTN